jgi:Hypoxia induced protein conserved region
MNLLNYTVPIALGAVFIVLLLGLFNMMRGGPANKSQMFMRWRVGLQFVAIILMMTALYFSRR